MKTLINVQNQIIEVEDIVYEDAYRYFQTGYKGMLADPSPTDDSIIKMPAQEFILKDQNFNQ